MANIYVRSTTGLTVTLPQGTQVGVIPSLIDNASSDYQSGISAGTITFVPTATAQTEIARSQIPVPNSGNNLDEGIFQISFPANASAGTTQTASVTLPLTPQKDAMSLVSIQVPSAIGTPITVSLQNGINFGSGVEPSTLTSLVVGAGTAQSYLVQGWLLGDGPGTISVVATNGVSATGGTVVIKVIKV